MISFKNLKKISIVFSNIFTVFILSFIFFSITTSSVFADSNKTLIVTFKTIPTYTSATSTALKYNKDFAYSYDFDDGLDDGYDPVFTYLNGGYSNYIGQYFGGLYFTDGAGNNVPFRGGYAFYTRNGAYSDLHLTTPSYITWTNLQKAVDASWSVINHGYTSSSIPEGDPYHVYYVGDPGGHATGTLDYSYELTQANVDIGAHITLRDNNGATTTPLQTRHVDLPNGDSNYTQPAFDLGFKSVASQNSTFFFDGSTTTAPQFTNVSNSISSNRLVMPRWFDYETRYATGGEYPGQLFNRIDQLAASSTGVTKYWARSFTHQVTTSTNPPDWNGGITWSTWKSLMDHIENTYGRYGNDKAWVASAEEVYDYLMVKQNTTLSQSLVGNQLTVTLNTGSVPLDLKHYALSLKVNSDAEIDSISYGTDFAYHTASTTSGLINLDWGDNAYSANDVTRVEDLVSTAETSLKQSDINVARSYNDLLDSVTSQNAFEARLDAIVVPLRTWYINIKGGITLITNCYSTTTKTFSPSVYNWNHFYIGKNSLAICSDLLNLKDSDGQVSTLSLSNTAVFNGTLSAAGTGSNSGIYPDAVLMDHAPINNASATTAKIMIGGLDNNKRYNIKLFGYTSSTGGTGNSAITVYTIGGIAKELYVVNNATNTVEFLNVSPVSSQVELSVVPKVPVWGYGELNAIEIKENLLAAPSSLSYTSPHVYTVNSAISSLTPTITGYEIVYSVSPSLPAGLSFSTSTGIISGTPTTASAESTYTVTATNNGGSTNFGLVLTVNDIAPSSISYNSPNTFTVGEEIVDLTPTVSGINLTYSVSPDLPTGLYFDASTGVISGTPSVAVASTTYTVTAENTGGSTSFGLSITVENSLSEPIHNVTKDTWYSTIQAAITAASSGDSIAVGAGTFYENVLINKPLTLTGVSSTTTIIDGGAVGNPINVNASNVSITDLKVTNSYSDSDAAGIRVNSGYTGFYLSDVIATGNNGSGIHVTSGASTIRNCIASDNIWGIRIDFSNNHTINNCQVFGNNRLDDEVIPSAYGQGIRVISVLDSTISSSTIYDNSRQAILISESGSDSRNITLTGNTIYNNGLNVAEGGIEATNADNVYIRNSTIRNNLGPGIKAASTPYVEVSSSTIYSNSSSNIIYQLSDYGTIFGNTIGTSTVDSIQFDRSNRANIYDNEVFGASATYYALSLTGASGSSLNNIYSNIIRNNDNGIKIETSSATNTIQYNQISTSTNYGLRIFTGAGLNNTIKSNLILGNKYGIRVSSSGNTIYDNRFVNTTNNVYSSTGTNTWNLNNILGTNILGGSYLGGNYWSNYIGVDANGDGFGDTSFNTLAGTDNLPLLSAVLIITTPPTVTVEAASLDTATSATLNGTITISGNASSTIRGFNYGTTTSYGLTTSSTGTFGLGSFNQLISNLTCNTTYHYQAFASNSAGIGTSTDQTFVTSACPVSYFTVIYSAGTNGSITGSTTQSILAGSSTSDVTAVPDSGYYFLKWDDDSVSNPRSNNNVQSNINLSAIFALTPVGNINFISPTPADSDIIGISSTTVKAEFADALNSSGFIDFNRDLLGYWNSESISGTTTNDDSQNNNDGILVNGVVTDAAAGIRGNSMSFNGTNQFITIPYASNLNVTNAFTVEAWVKRTGAQTNQWAQIVNRNADNGFNLQHDSTNTKFEFAVRTNTNRYYINATPAGGIQDNTWYHVVGVYDGSNMILYVNGIELTRRAQSGTVIQSNKPLYIGKRSDNSATNDRYFKGNIDEVKYWNKALTLNEVRDSYLLTVNNFSSLYSNLISGNYNYRACIINSAGSYNCTENRNLAVNLDPLSVTINSPLQKTYIVNDINFDITLNKSVDSCSYSLNSTTSVPMDRLSSTHYQYSAVDLNEGLFDLNFTCIDSSSDTVVRNISFAVDTIPPAIDLESPISTTYLNSDQLTFNFTPYKTGVGTISECKLFIGDLSSVFNQDDSGIHTWSNPANSERQTVIETISEGSHKWNVWCKDSSDNSDWSQLGSQNFIVDLTDPTFTNIPSNAIIDHGTSWSGVTFTATDTVQFLEYYLVTPADGFTIDNSGLLKNDSILALGTYNIEVGIRDTAGNTNSAAYVLSVVDTVAPDITITSPINTIYNTRDQNVEISVFDVSGSISSIWYNWDGTDVIYTGTTTVLFNEGSNTLNVWAKDNVDNISSSSVTFEINTTSTTTYYSLNYSTNTNGSITGSSTQSVSEGEDGTEVEAIPNSGYSFVRWSDGSTINPRIDREVTENKNIEAVFTRQSSGGSGTGSRIVIKTATTTTPINTPTKDINNCQFLDLLINLNIIDMDKVFQARQILCTDTSDIINGSATTSIINTVNKFIFTRNLKIGMIDEDVKELQKFLNNHGYVLISTGLGSPGNETNFFGILTYQALIRFQEANFETVLKPLNLIKGTGKFYEYTRKLVNSLL